MVAIIERQFKTGQGRIFAQWNGAAPYNAVEYQGMARLGGLSESLGDVTAVRAPSSVAYSRYDVVDYIRGEPGLPTTSLIARFGYVNRILTQQCKFDIHAHYGSCKNPMDFNSGWDKGLCYEQAVLTARNTDDLTGLDGTDNMITFTGEITALRFWEYDQMTLGAKAADYIETEIVDVIVADYISCGDCGYESDGNKRIFAVQISSGASPGILNELVYTDDGGSTWEDETISTLTVSEAASGIAVAGEYIVVVSGAVASLSYATLDDPSTWNEVTTGFVATKYPNAVFSLSATLTWLAAEDGYIYFSENPVGGVEVQSDGSATAEDLLCIHGIDPRNLIAGGESGALLLTDNGGQVWSAAASVPGGIGDILTVWMRTTHCWMIGDSNGTLWYTKNAGVSWTQITFPVTAPTDVTDIVFADHADSPFGFMTVKTASAGYILRTIDGGRSWYQLPDGAGAMPANAGLNCVSAGNSASMCVAGGLASAGTDGILIIGQG
jgi:photosystem II stability/assembly factor-like uncharacterized protein